MEVVCYVRLSVVIKACEPPAWHGFPQNVGPDPLVFDRPVEMVVSTEAPHNLSNASQNAGALGRIDTISLGHTVLWSNQPQDLVHPRFSLGLFQTTYRLRPNLRDRDGLCATQYDDIPEERVIFGCSAVAAVAGLDRDPLRLSGVVGRIEASRDHMFGAAQPHRSAQLASSDTLPCHPILRVPARYRYISRSGRLRQAAEKRPCRSGGPRIPSGDRMRLLTGLKAC